MKTWGWEQRVFSQIVKDEPDETFEAWRILVKKVPSVRLEEGDFSLWRPHIKRIVKAEQKRRLKLKDKK